MNSTPAVNPVDDELAAFERAMEAMVPSSKQHKEVSCMAKSYAVIEQTRARKVTVKVVLEAFNATYGLNIHPARFRKLLEEERERREKAGERVLCEHCGQPLVAERAVEDAGGVDDERERLA